MKKLDVELYAEAETTCWDNTYDVTIFNKNDYIVETCRLNMEAKYICEALTENSLLMLNMPLKPTFDDYVQALGLEDYLVLTDEEALTKLIGIIKEYNDKSELKDNYKDRFYRIRYNPELEKFEVSTGYTNLICPKLCVFHEVAHAKEVMKNHEKLLKQVYGVE